MSWAGLWLLTIVTRPPRRDRHVDGLTRPSAPIVIVAVGRRRGRRRRRRSASSESASSALCRCCRRRMPPPWRRPASPAASPFQIALRHQKNFLERLKPKIPVVLRRAAARHLRQRRAEAVREVQLEHVAAGALLEAEADQRHARARSRRRAASLRRRDRCCAARAAARRRRPSPCRCRRPVPPDQVRCCRRTTAAGRARRDRRARATARSPTPGEKLVAEVVGAVDVDDRR